MPLFVGKTMSPKEEKSKFEISQEEEKELTDIAVGFARAVMQVRIFGAENPLAKKAIEETSSFIEEFLKKKDVVLYIHEGKLKFGEFPIAERNPTVTRLVDLFTKDKMISIGFEKGFSMDNFVKLLNILAKRPDDIAKAGGVEKLVEEESIPGIRINPITYELLEKDEEIGKDKEKTLTAEEPVRGSRSDEEEGESRFSDEDLAAGRKKPKIVIVDNDRETLKSMRLSLTEDYAVATTKSCKIALELLKGIEVDLIICAHNSEIAGIETLENVSQNFPNVVKILILDKADPSTMMKAINSVSLYKLITKPWDSARMLDAIRIAITQRKLIIADELLSQELKKREVALRRDQEEFTSTQTS